MFKKLFDGILDICKPGDDEPICQWGGTSESKNRESNPENSDDPPYSVEGPEKDSDSSP